MEFESFSYTERQIEELNVLQAIYPNELDDLRGKAVWNVWQPNKIKLRLSPQESQSANHEVFAQVDMVVTCSTRYPDDVPTIELLSPKNVPDINICTLKNALDCYASEHRGTVIINDLAEKVREFLREYNSPPSGSFFDQMTDKQKNVDLELAEQQLLLEEQDKQTNKEQEREVRALMRKRQQQLMESARSKKDSIKLVEDSTQDGLQQVDCCDNNQNSILSIETTPANFQGNIKNDVLPNLRTSTWLFSVSFKKGKEEWQVHCHQLLENLCNGRSNAFLGMDERTGECVTVREWVFQWKTFFKKKAQHRAAQHQLDLEGEQYCGELRSIEMEASQLMRLAHPNIVQYLAFKWQYDPGKITTYVLSEFFQGESLDIEKHGNQPLSIEVLHHHTEGMVRALTYLHSCHIVHRLLRPSCVFIDENGNVRVSDFAINKKLRALYTQINKSSVSFEDSTERMPKSFGFGAQKDDIFYLGVTVQSLAMGKYLLEPKVPVGLDLLPVLCDFLNRCLVRDQHQRWSASQLLEHPFIKEPLNAPTIPMKPERLASEPDHKLDRDEIEYGVTKNTLSRLDQEFEKVCELGKGAFGDVWKVRMKLDGQVYAVKRIRLNPASRQFNKEKITNEVNLLSRLQHENIQPLTSCNTDSTSKPQFFGSRRRYYNSWMEVSGEPAVSEQSSVDASSQYNHPVDDASRWHVGRHKCELSNFFVDVEEVAPQMQDANVSWSCSLASNHVNEEDSSDDYDHDDHWCGRSFSIQWDKIPSHDIEFTDENGDHGDEKKCNYHVNLANSVAGSDERRTIVTPTNLSYLYIQMEYCERSTLRQAIDEQELYKDRGRVWCYFRGIVEGLRYIHDQRNMIHRDLKPVNIFLDAKDNIKIGDFGLATTDIVKHKKSTMDDCVLASAARTTDSCDGLGPSSGEGMFTGKVGTALYLSPEMMRGESKTRYDQKVDIYSLGIIFFEMLYPKLSTVTERVKVLTQLRHSDIIFPSDFDVSNHLTSQKELLLCMLNHDPNVRPSSKELLDSKHLPPVQEVEAQFIRKVDEAVRNPDSQSCRRILSGLFSQKYSKPMDRTYNMDQHLNCYPERWSLLQDLTAERVEHVFRSHGAIRLDMPILTPRPPHYAAQDLLPCFLDRSGAVVNLPFDLRLPFARFLAHNPHIVNMKRYSIQPVYRAARAESLHPRQCVECAFDIVSSVSRLLEPDAELLTIVEHIIKMFPVVQASFSVLSPFEDQFVVRMNHTKLIKSALLGAGVPTDKLHPLLEKLVACKVVTESTVWQALSHLNIRLTKVGMCQLKRCLLTEGDLTEVTPSLSCLTRQKNHIGLAARQGLEELAVIQETARALGFQLKMLLSVSLVYNLLQYSGLIFQVSATYKRQTSHHSMKEVSETIASGGRYNRLVSEFSTNGEVIEISAVGVSLSFDFLLSSLTQEDRLQVPSLCDVMLCSLGQHYSGKERYAVARMLLDNSIRTAVHYEPLEDLAEIQKKCLSLSIPFLVIIKDKDGDVNCVKVKIMGCNIEKRVTISGLVPFLQQRLTSSKLDRDREFSVEPLTCSHRLDRSSSGKSAVSLTFTYLLQASLSVHAKKKMEIGVGNRVPKWLSGDVEVVISDLGEDVIRHIQGQVELNREEIDFDQSVDRINVRSAKRSGNLIAVIKQIKHIRFEKKKHFILLYGMNDDVLRILS